MQSEASETTTISAYYHWIVSAIRGDPIKVGLALFFFWGMLLQGIKDTLRFDWDSLGVFIGAEAQEVTPLSVLRVRMLLQTSSYMIWDFSSSSGGYRIHCATNQTYINRLQTTLKEQLITPSFRESKEVFIINLAPLYSDSEYLNWAYLLSVADMFFGMFSKHPRPKLQFGALIMAYKDCTGLSVISHDCDLIQHSTRLYARWLVTPTLRNERNKTSIFL